MRKKSRKFLEQVAKYSKEEIIEAIGKNIFIDADTFLSDLVYIRRTKALEEHNKAIKKEEAAFDAYLACRKELFEKYGDGKSVKFSDVPAGELKRVANLEKAWREAIEAEQKHDAKIKKLFNL